MLQQLQITESIVFKLNKYIDRARESIIQAEARLPGFFHTRQAQLRQKHAQIAAIEKLIGWIHGNSSLIFTEDEINTLSQGVIGNILKHIPLTIPKAISTERQDVENRKCSNLMF